MTILLAFSITAMAETAVTLYVDSTTADDTASRADQATYKTIAGALAKAEIGDTIKLMSNVTENVTINTDKAIVLDLNNHVLSGTGDETINVIENSGTLYICDSDNSALRYFTYNIGSAWAYISEPTNEQTTSAITLGDMSNAELTSGTTVIAVSGGCITGSVRATCIYNSGSLYLQGGNIIGNNKTNNNGGGVYNIESASFTMTGGNIIGNFAGGFGGGIYNKGILYLQGGCIAENIAQIGGGVNNCGDTAFTTMTGGSITGNNATYGGGLFNEGGTVTLGGIAKIYDNESSGLGDNLLITGLIALGTGTDKPVSGMNVGVTLVDSTPASTMGAFTSNGTEDDTQYFTSDEITYCVEYDTTNNCLMLAVAPIFDDRFGGKYSFYGTEAEYTSYGALSVGTEYTVHDTTKYTFAGWYTGIDGTGTKLEDAPESGAKYYAKWTNNGKTVLTQPINFITKLSEDKLSTEGWNWNYADNILTLAGLTLDVYSDEKAEDSANIQSIMLLTNGAILNIEDGTTNTVKLNSTTNAGYVFAIEGRGILSIEGAGTLNVNATKESDVAGLVTVYAISAGGKLSIADATLNVFGQDKAIYKGDTNTDNIEIISGTINAKCNTTDGAVTVEDNGKYVIHAEAGDIVISGGIVNANGGAIGIIAGNGSFIISGGAVTVDSGTHGLWSLTHSAITGGTVKATAHGYKEESTGKSAKAIYSQGKINISGSAVVTATCINDKNVTEDGAKFFAIRAKKDITVIGNEAVVTAKGDTSAYNSETGMKIVALDATITANEAIDCTGTPVAINQDADGSMFTSALSSAKYVKISFNPVCTLSYDGNITSYASIQAAIDAHTDGRVITLISDAVASDDIFISSGRTIDLILNGHVLDLNQHHILNQGELNISDNSSSLVHYFNYSSTAAWTLNTTTTVGIELSEITAETPENTVVKVYGGVITNGYSADNGGAISMQRDNNYVKTFLKGGNIVGCTSKCGGAIFQNEGFIQIDGGNIYGCYASESGGAVDSFSNTSAEVDFAQGTIGYCSSAIGGAIYNRENSVLKIMTSNAAITNCYASNIGGGVCTNGKFDMIGGIIKYCTADKGGGVFVNKQVSAAAFIGDATITSNTAITRSGGIEVKGNITLGGKANITGNKLGSEDSNLYLNGDNCKVVVLESQGYVSEIDNAMSVGITTSTVPAVGTPVTITGTNSAIVIRHFTSDNSNYNIVSTKVGDYYALQLTADPLFDNRFDGKYSLTGSEDDYTSYGALVKNDKYTVYDGTQYKFAGWFTGIDGAGDELTGTPVAGTTYYAKWLNAYGNTVVTTTMNFKKTPSSTIPTGSGITWSAISNTVELNNVTIDTKDQVGLNLPADSTVLISGTNTVKSTLDGDYTNNKTAGIYSDKAGSLVITGNGVLNTYSGNITKPFYGTFTSTSLDRLSAGVYVNGNLTISGITLYAQSGNVDYEDDSSSYDCGRSMGILSRGKVTIVDATVVAKAGDGSTAPSSGSTENNGFSIGLHSYNTLEIINSTVTAISGHAKQDTDGIYAGWAFGSKSTIPAYGTNNMFLANIVINNSSVSAISGTTTEYDTIGMYAHNSIYITNSTVNAKNGGARGSVTEYGQARGAGIFRNEELIIDHSKVTAVASGNAIFTYAHESEFDSQAQKTATFGGTYIKNNSVVKATSLDNDSSYALVACNVLSVSNSTLECNVANAGIDAVQLYDTVTAAAVDIDGLVLSNSGKIVTNGIVRVVELDDDNSHYSLGNANDKKYPVTNGTVGYLDGTTSVVTPTATTMTINAVVATPSYNSPTYRISVASTTNGKVTVDKLAAEYGETIIVTVTADEIYTLSSIRVTKSNGKEEVITKRSNGQYSFYMPYSEVTVSAEFTKIQTTCPKDETCVLSKYDDVIIDSWYHDGAHYCVENGIMLGTGTKFKPADTIIRAEVIQILYNLAGKPSTDFEMTFTDVAEGQWYTDAVRWAQSVGIAKGSDNKFKPTDAITREEFATMLYRYEQIVNGGGFTGAWVFPITGFDDVDMISGWADEAMHWMTMNQIVQGSNGNINPTGNASRADVATMVQRFCTLDK